MSLFRATPQSGTAWITGASTGIGRQLALELAKDGYKIIATARSMDKLQSLATDAEPFKGSIIPMACDVTDETAMAKLVEEAEAAHGPIALAVFNAGNYWPTTGKNMSIEAYRKTFDVNVFGALNGMAPIVEKFKQRGQGQLALVASVSGYAGLPNASAYGPSKAALNNLAESLKFDFDKMNIRIQLVNPGFIDTPLTEKNEFAMPALMPLERAARRFADGLATGGFELHFPRRFTYFVKAMSLLPHPLYFWLMKKATGWDKN